MARTILLEFDGLDDPVALVNAGGLVKCLKKVFLTWRFRAYGARYRAREAPICVRGSREGYRIHSRWADEVAFRDDPVDAVCALVIEVNRAYLRAHPEFLCLHGAAAEFSGRLVVFPNQYRAGKSLLSGCLAASGIRIWADDIMAVDASAGSGVMHGLATGVAPRLRRPLPDDLVARARKYFERHRGPASDKYLYLDLDHTRLAERGERAGIGGFVLLDRSEGAAPELIPVPESEMLKQVVWQNFARQKDSSEILAGLRALIARSALYRLRYSHGGEAVAVLKAKFSDWDAFPTCDTAPPQPGDGGETTVAPEVDLDLAIRHAPEDPQSDHLQQCPGIFEQGVDGERFLADSQGAAIHHLNPTAANVWKLLSEPMPETEIVELLSCVFPDVARTRIAGDVAALLAALEAKNLIRRVRPPAPSDRR